jgi:hypothetical protein
VVLCTGNEEAKRMDLLSRSSFPEISRSSTSVLINPNEEARHLVAA